MMNFFCMNKRGNLGFASCTSSFAFGTNLNKSMLVVKVIYVRSMISSSRCFRVTLRCVPWHGSESEPARWIDNLPPPASLIPCVPGGFLGSVKWTSSGWESRHAGPLAGLSRRCRQSPVPCGGMLSPCLWRRERQRQEGYERCSEGWTLNECNPVSMNTVLLERVHSCV